MNDLIVYRDVTIFRGWLLIESLPIHNRKKTVVGFQGQKNPGGLRPPPRPPAMCFKYFTEGIFMIKKNKKNTPYLSHKSRKTCFLNVFLKRYGRFGLLGATHALEFLFSEKSFGYDIVTMVGSYGYIFFRLRCMLFAKIHHM